MGKKKAIGLDGRLTILAQALIDYAEEGGRYSVEALATGEGADGLEPAGVAIALWETELVRVHEKDAALPAYKLVYAGDTCDQCGIPLTKDDQCVGGYLYHKCEG